MSEDAFDILNGLPFSQAYAVDIRGTRSGGSNGTDSPYTVFEYGDDSLLAGQRQTTVQSNRLYLTAKITAQEAEILSSLLLERFPPDPYENTQTTHHQLLAAMRSDDPAAAIDGIAATWRFWSENGLHFIHGDIAGGTSGYRIAIDALELATDPQFTNITDEQRMYLVAYYLRDIVDYNDYQENYFRSGNEWHHTLYRTSGAVDFDRREGHLSFHMRDTCDAVNLLALVNALDPSIAPQLKGLTSNRFILPENSFMRLCETAGLGDEAEALLNRVKAVSAKRGLRLAIGSDSVSRHIFREGDFMVIRSNDTFFAGVESRMRGMVENIHQLNGALGMDLRATLSPAVGTYSSGNSYNCLELRMPLADFALLAKTAALEGGKGASPSRYS